LIGTPVQLRSTMAKEETRDINDRPGRKIRDNEKLHTVLFSMPRHGDGLYRMYLGSMMHQVLCIPVLNSVGPMEHLSQNPTLLTTSYDSCRVSCIV
jgi:hypothetical protein